MKNKIVLLTAGALMAASMAASAVSPTMQTQDDVIKNVTASGTLKFNVSLKDQNQRRVKIKTDELIFKVNDFTMKSSPIVFSGKQTKGSHGLWFGPSNIDIKSLTVSDNEKAFKINGVHLFHDAVDHGKTMDGKVNIKLGPIVEGGNKANFKASLSVAGANTAAAKRIVVLFNEMADKDFNPDPAFVFKAMPTLLAFYSGTTVDAKFTAADNHQLNVQGTLHLKAPKNPDQLLGPEEVIMKSEGSFDFVMDKKSTKQFFLGFLEQQKQPAGAKNIKDKIQHYVDLGYLRPQGKNYTAHMTLNAGKLMINGHLLVDMNAAHVEKTLNATPEKHS